MSHRETRCLSKKKCSPVRATWNTISRVPGRQSGRQRKDNSRPAQTSGPATGCGIGLDKSAGAFNEDDVTKTIWLRHRENATHADGNEWAAGDSHRWQGFARSNSDFFWMSG
ncbi:hypothetical protein CSHISOI_00207 [Colletotrichum shisoi]|uniref:Uncharacterized protein n=1 Tax=Colletotrichum shisoi TaxID=2078593 RepID=A0A5Q4C7C4_9PEZI|nr:hypothetical protein CSHISOI_00207 [Colletotrichum shisoi]